MTSTSLFAERRAHLVQVFVSHEPEFADVTGDDPRLACVLETDAHEGPVYLADEDALFFTTLPRPAKGRAPRVGVARLQLDGLRFPVRRAHLRELRTETTAANGMTLDLEAKLVVCEQGGPRAPARISRVDPQTGDRETLVDAYNGLPLNSPNDVVVASDGSIWFTDPSYGHLQGFRPQPRLGDNVYRHDPRTGRTRVVSDAFDKPNGLAFSTNERVLYVGDSGANHERGSFEPSRPHEIVAFDVEDETRLSTPRLLATIAPGFPDGLKVDLAGRIYASCFSGIQVFARTGALLGEIRLPGAVNFTFGGPERNVLFITTDTAVWAAVLNAKGA